MASEPKGVCGRGGTQAIGNKTILPAWARGGGRGEIRQAGRVCTLGSHLLQQHVEKRLFLVLCGEGWAGLAGSVGSKKTRSGRRPTPVGSVPRLLLSRRKGAAGTGTDDEVGA